MMEYDKEELTQTIFTEELIRHFRNEEEVSGYCRECENFGKSWGCPPFDFDVEDRLKQYKEVLLVATKITPKEQGLPLNAAQELILPERRRIDKRLLELEKEHSGLACSYVGKCYYCAEESCSRVCGLPCRHPHLVRPSLEAYGFDVALISQELFGIKLRWSKDGLLPEYLVIVCALFYNAPENVNVHYKQY
jgi:predicted metal-binding protein